MYMFVSWSGTKYRSGNGMQVSQLIYHSVNIKQTAGVVAQWYSIRFACERPRYLSLLVLFSSPEPKAHQVSL